MPRRSFGFFFGSVALLLPSVAVSAPTQPGELVNDLFLAEQCEFCHGYGNAGADLMEPPYSPLSTWQGTLMANSARDPVFWAGVTVDAADGPEETDLCIRCHAPRAFLDGHETIISIDSLEEPERNGVECEFCHRMIEDVGVPPGNAMYTIDDVLPAGASNVPRHGPWDFNDGVPEPPHEWVFDPYTGRSRLCGTCHDVTTGTPRVDDDGNQIAPGFNEQRTYGEWARSAYGTPGEDFRSCQDCHMTAVEDKPGCSSHVNQFTHATGGRRHDFNGANRFMIEMLREEYGSNGDNEIPDIYFDLNIERMDEFLTTAASIEVAPPESVDVRRGLGGLEVTVTNHTGHKLPSGYSEGRVMWLEVVGTYGDEVLFSSGAWNPDDGIQEDPQIRRYEGIGEDLADGTRFHLLRNNHWLVDSRIPPLGLQPHIDTDPVGDRYTLLPDGTWPNYDVASYAFEGIDGLLDQTPDDATDDELTLTVRLRYLINTPEYIDFLGENGGEAGVHVAGLFEAAGGAPPVTLAEQTLTIPLTGLGGNGGDSSSTTDAESSTTDPTGQSGTGVSTSDTTAGPTTLDPTQPGTADSSESSGGNGANDDDGGCGCTGGGNPSGAPLLLLPLLALRRRRRPRS